MVLAARQIAILDAMGIPVWQTRNNKTAQTETITEQALTTLSEEEQRYCDQLLATADYVIYCEEQQDASQSQLLRSIVKAMGWSWHDHLCLNRAQIEYASEQINVNKVMLTCLCFTDKGEQLISHGALLTMPSLSTLLKQPELKKQVWSQLNGKLSSSKNA